MSSNSSRSYNPPSYCYCNQRARRRTAWTELNIGKRFLGCGRYPGVNACNFFKWLDDPPICDRGREILEEMKHKIGNYNDEIHECRTGEAKMHAEIKELTEKNQKLELLKIRNMEEIVVLKTTMEKYRKTSVGFRYFVGFVLLCLLIFVLGAIDDDGRKNLGQQRLP
ncbi:hypothetical protein M5689_024305 [Euphorbia peplus]|nr:hypothetical protein M5689_024305 [Euphorbia peplus]